MINFESFVDIRNSIILKQNPPSHSVILSLTPKFKNHIFFENYYAFLYTYVILFLLLCLTVFGTLFCVYILKLNFLLKILLEYSLQLRGV